MNVSRRSCLKARDISQRSMKVINVHCRRYLWCPRYHPAYCHHPVLLRTGPGKRFTTTKSSVSRFHYSAVSQWAAGCRTFYQQKTPEYFTRISASSNMPNSNSLNTVKWLMISMIIMALGIVISMDLNMVWNSTGATGFQVWQNLLKWKNYGMIWKLLFEYAGPVIKNHWW